VRVAIASDFNPGTCYMENMALAISLAVLKLKLTPEEALRAATLGGARALGREEQIGSLEPGKLCDLAVLEARTYYEIPYHVGANLAHVVVVGGQIVAGGRGNPHDSVPPP
jgi:imidazolonepropionase